MILDRSQQEIVGIKDERALVLAGPGCGKTHILAQRIIVANGRDGVSFDDMVCLTFTNRASREMNKRITAELGYRPQGLFVGNIHRFCIRFLYSNAILPNDVSVIDEDDRDLWLSESLKLRRAADRNEVLSVGILLFQQEHGFPMHLRQRLPFRASASHINAAMAYRDYKRENRIVDFDDVILMAYEVMMRDGFRGMSYSSYKWIQVDEVQDLTPLQLAIIDKITSPCGATVVYLGDEQQAIFEFIGAGGPALDRLKMRCEGHIYRLRRNYRSPGYLVKLCNDFASFQLGMDPSDLPEPDDSTMHASGALTLLPSSDHNLDYAVVAKVRAWLSEYPDESIAVLVRTNDEAEQISAKLMDHGFEHVLISRKDLFKQVPYKTIFAHFAVVANPAKMVEWSRLLYQTRAVATMSESRSLVHRLREAAMTPADFFDADGKTALQRMAESVDDEVIVVFDTETTGLDLFSDDIIQVAAVKFCGGRVVPDSSFEVLVRTDRTIPAMLRDGVINPMVEEYKAGHPVSPDEAFSSFFEYVGDAVLCGHNAEFDMGMLKNNLRRRTTMRMPESLERPAIDTLLVARLVLPMQRSYALSAMIDLFGLPGCNSHRALDDAKATAALLGALIAPVKDKLPQQERLLKSSLVAKAAMRLNAVYFPIYEHTRLMLANYGA